MNEEEDKDSSKSSSINLDIKNLLSDTLKMSEYNFN